MSTARRGYATPAPVDRTRSTIVMQREAERRAMRAAKHRATPLDVESLQRELSSATASRRTAAPYAHTGFELGAL